MVSAGAAAPSSSMMAPTPSSAWTLPASWAFDGLDSRRTTVSSASSRVSPVTVTSTALLVWFGAKVRVPPASFA